MNIVVCRSVAKSMSASSVEIKGIAKNDCSSSSSKKNENSHSAPAGLNLKTRVLPRKSQGRQAGFISGGTVNGLLKSEIRQRILSARQHRQKSLQSQLTLALQQNAELANENRLFKTLQKRQDNALAKYEGSSGELPQLISRHSDELRVWQTKYRALNVQNRELNKKLQQKDKIINDLNDRLKHLTILTAEKHLEEREILQAKVESLEHKLNEREEEIKILTRRNIIEAKNFKTQLSNERKKAKELCQKQNTEKQSGSSNDADYSNAKDAKEVKHVSATSLSTSSTISEESTAPQMDLLVDIVGDDDDLVIKSLVDAEPCTDDSDQIAKHLADVKLFANDGADNIHAIHQKIKNDIEKNEALLDQHCSEISLDIGALNLSKELSLFDFDISNDLELSKTATDFPLFSRGDKSSGSKEPFSASSEKTKMPRTASCLPRFNINLSAKPLKRALIDPQRKSKLLAQLKSIQSGNGCL